MAYAVHLMANAHLMTNAVHPSEASDVHDGICSTPVGKYSTPSELLMHMIICSTLYGKSSALAGKCSTPMRLLMNMIRYVVHLIANAVHLSGAPDALCMIVSTVHLMANAVHQRWAPEV